MAKTINMDGFSKYQFSINEIGQVTILNLKGEEIKKSGNSWRLTNDEGKRATVSTDQVLLVANMAAIEDTRKKEVEVPAKEEKTDDQKVSKAKRSVKLSAEQAAKIRERITSGDKQSVIAKDYGVHQSTISDIKAGRLYPVALEVKDGVAGPALEQTEEPQSASIAK